MKQQFTKKQIEFIVKRRSSKILRPIGYIQALFILILIFSFPFLFAAPFSVVVDWMSVGFFGALMAGILHHLILSALERKFTETFEDKEPWEVLEHLGMLGKYRMLDNIQRPDVEVEVLDIELQHEIMTKLCRILTHEIKKDVLYKSFIPKYRPDSIKFSESYMLVVEGEDTNVVITDGTLKSLNGVEKTDDLYKHLVKLLIEAISRK